MSKQKPPIEPVEPGVTKLGEILDIVSRKAPVPAKVEIGTCIGKMVDCPSCGKAMLVMDARGARTATQVISSKFWVRGQCQGFCGAVLHPTKTLVTLRPEPEPEPVWKTLGAAVGKFVRCPRDIGSPDGIEIQCGAKAMAAWTLDDGHVIRCPVCPEEAYPGDTLVQTCEPS